VSTPRKSKAPAGRNLRLRAAAEAQLALSTASPPQPQLRTYAKVVHELEVHQFELEMRNQELNRSQRALEESRDKYLDLYDFGPVGYLTFTRAGRIAEANLTGATLLGVARSKLLGRWLSSFMAPEDRDGWERHLASVVHPGCSTPSPGEKQSCELRLKRPDGSFFHVRLESIRVDRAEGGESAGAVGTPPVIRSALTDITERVQAERTSLEAHKLVTSVFESITDGFVSLDSQWRFIYVNCEAEHLMGRPKEQLLGRILWEVFPPATSSTFRREFERAVADNQTVRFEEFYLPLDKWFQVHAYPSATGLSVYFQNITKRKRLDEAQEFLLQCGYQSSGEDFFHALARFLAQNLRMDLVCIDRLLEDGRTAQPRVVYHDGKFAEHGAYALDGTASGSVVGQTICHFPMGVCGLFPEDERLQTARAESYVGTTLRGSTGRPIGLIAVMGRTPQVNPHLADAMLKLVAVRAGGELERESAEAALRKEHDLLEARVQERTFELQQSNECLRREMLIRRITEQQLTEVELRYWTVAQFTHEWEYWETPEYLLRYCSPACERITGYSAQEFLDDPRLLQRIVHPDDASLWLQHRAEGLVASEPRVLELRIRKKDGTVRWIEHAWQSVLRDDGFFLGIRASNRDVTERKAEQLQAQESWEKLTHVSRISTAGQLAASLAHELSQPLTAIRCNAATVQLLQAAVCPDVVEVRKALEDIVQDSDRAGAMIESLRALFSKTVPKRSLFQLNDVIQETLDLLRGELVLKEVSARSELEPALPRVLGHRIELQQVVLNLAVNAIEAMSAIAPAQRHLSITTAFEEGRGIRVAVRDSGPGIQVQPMEQLFEPFFTTKADGMGMGLAICRAILEAHDGSVCATNNPDRGATFYITLPILPAPIL